MKSLDDLLSDKESLDDLDLRNIKVLSCDICNRQIGFIAECDNQSSVYCPDCVEAAFLRQRLSSRIPRARQSLVAPS